MTEVIKKVLWLDDLRDPNDILWKDYIPLYFSCELTWVKNYDDFCDWIIKNGLPTTICFDHDLGSDISREKVKNGMSKSRARKEKIGTKTGMDAAKWLVDYCIDNDLDLPMWIIQSANPVGKDNINGILTSYRKFRALN